MSDTVTIEDTGISATALHLTRWAVTLRADEGKPVETSEDLLRLFADCHRLCRGNAYK